ncbi:hypothetical protein GS982_20240 [Rhodococcus hoagii]|nr:hypothetical protein [Prescottella equi]NKZ84524.1 hypothetical protein [Prescottella equi]
MARARTSRSAIERAKLQEKAMQLRLRGATIVQIAKVLDVSKSTAQRLVSEAITEIKREPTELVIDLELNRLDAMLTGIFPDAVKGDLKAIDRVLKLMERRSKYMNLDSAAPPDTSGEARQALADLMGSIRTNAVGRQQAIAKAAFAAKQAADAEGESPKDDDQ